MVIALLGMYTQAANHYDEVRDNRYAELYRQKIPMLFIKPHVALIYGGGKKEEPERQEKPANEQRDTTESAVSVDRT